MARGLFRKTSFNKMVGAYRSQWKRFWMRLFTFGMYGRKGMGWWRDPKKAWYNWWYHRTSISIPRLLGYRPSRASFFCAMLVASVISIFAAPVDATRAGVKAHKIKTERKARATSGGSRSSNSTSRTATGTTNRSSADATNRTTSYTPRTTTLTARDTVSTQITSNTTETKTGTPTQSSVTSTAQIKTPSTSVSKPRTTSTPKPKVTYTSTVKKDAEEKKTPTCTFSATTYSCEPIKPTTPPEPEVKEPDEKTPKSKPKHEGDHYIRKRMIIAGSSYCDKPALDKLTIGTYFELVAEPTNPYDKDAVMLVHDGEKIGYIAKQDKLAFVTCLKLKRRIYGVITDIINEPYPTKYEFETWFDSVK